jgi:hypothetical protein
MTFQDRFSQPRDGHQLVTLEREAGVHWCLRCGSLWLEARPGLRDVSRWEKPGQAGHSLESVAAPPCVAATDAGAGNVAGDGRLMLHALTHGFRCEPVLLQVKVRTEAWRWWHDGLFGEQAWSVAGAWEDGPVVDDTVRRVLLTGTDQASPRTARGG